MEVIFINGTYTQLSGRICCDQRNRTATWKNLSSMSSQYSHQMQRCCVESDVENLNRTVKNLMSLKGKSYYENLYTYINAYFPEIRTYMFQLLESYGRVRKKYLSFVSES
jgi:hypothetical protein